MTKRTGAGNWRRMVVAPLAIYPVALLLLGARGWWTGSAEAVVAAPVTALLFELIHYPLAVLLLWSVDRGMESHGAPLRVAAAIALAVGAHWALVWPLGLFHLPAAFMAALVGATSLARALLGTPR